MQEWLIMTSNLSTRVSVHESSFAKQVCVTARILGQKLQLIYLYSCTVHVTFTHVGAIVSFI